MRKWFVIAFVVLLLIYTGCAIRVPLGLYGWDAYFKIVGVVGGACFYHWTGCCRLCSYRFAELRCRGDRKTGNAKIVSLMASL